MCTIITMHSIVKKREGELKNKPFLWGFDFSSEQLSIRPESRRRYVVCSFDGNLWPMLLQASMPLLFFLHAGLVDAVDIILISHEEKKNPLCS